MGDIHYIVDKLNAPPFQYNLSLLSFRFVPGDTYGSASSSGSGRATALLDRGSRSGLGWHCTERGSHSKRLVCVLFPRSEKTPQELLQLISDIFSLISPKHQVREALRVAAALTARTYTVRPATPIEAPSFTRQCGQRHLSGHGQWHLPHQRASAVTQQHSARLWCNWARLPLPAMMCAAHGILAPMQRIDVSKEDPDQTVDRLISFLKIIKYKPNYDA